MQIDGPSAANAAMCRAIIPAAARRTNLRARRVLFLNGLFHFRVSSSSTDKVVIAVVFAGGAKSLTPERPFAAV
jgi:hypothetical protein